MADNSAQRAARQKALAEKKRRLEEIKARRNNTAALSTNYDDDDDDAAAAAEAGSKQNNKNLESYIDDLLKSSTPGLSLASISVEENDDDNEKDLDGKNNQPEDNHDNVDEPTTTESSAPTAPATLTALQLQNPPQTNTTRALVETFEVAIQCDEEEFPPPSLVPDDEDDDDKNEDMIGSTEEDDGKNNPESDINNNDKNSPSFHQTNNNSTDGGANGTVAMETIFLSPEEKSKVLSSKPFHQFLSTASKRVERLLGSTDDDVHRILMYGTGWKGEGMVSGLDQKVDDERENVIAISSGAGIGGIDFTVDYANDNEDNDDYDHGSGQNFCEEEGLDTDAVSATSGLLLRQRRQRPGGKSSSHTKAEEPYQVGGYFTARVTYEFAKFTKGRNVTDIEWCPGHGEWVLASYSAVGITPPSTSGEGATVLDRVIEVVGIGGANSWSRNNPTTRHLSPHDPSSSFLQKITATAVCDTTTSSQPVSSHHHRTSHIPDEGIVAIYNLSMPSRPEHIFCAGCSILHSQFHPTEHPRLIVGGGSSGQVLVWDARAGRFPVQRSSASSAGCHSCELVGMKVLGDGGGESISTSKLVTASSDGTVNYWSVTNLREPIESVIVDANLCSLDVLHGDVTNESIVCGDERGGVHAIFPGTGRDVNSLNKRVTYTVHPGAGIVGAGLDPIANDEGNLDATAARAFDESSELGHYGMVTSVAARPLIQAHNTPRYVSKEAKPSSKGFVQGPGGLLVTTGVDWSTKLWAPAYSNKPLTSFLSNSYDFVCDARWSPVHPSTFITSSSNGTLSIWNLASMLDQPISGTNGIAVDGSDGAVNRIQWSTDGRLLAVASGDKLHVLGVGEHVWKVKGDEESRVMHNLVSRGLIQQE